MSNIYMHLPTAQGGVSAEGYQGWIALHSVHFAASRHIAMKVGKGAQRESSIPQFAEIEITKSLDAASNTLFQYTCSGQSIDKVEIHVCTTDASPEAYAKYVFSNVMIAQHTHQMCAESLPAETLKLNYTQLQITHINRDQRNAAQAPHVIAYNLETAQLS